MNIDPYGMTVIEWTDAMAYLLDGEPPSRKLLDPENWKDWAEDLKDVANFAGQNIPNPHGFDDWFEWAQRFNSTVELA